VGQVVTSTDQTDPDAVWATPIGGSAASLTPTALKSSGTYAATAGDLVLVDLSTASVTIALPTAPADQKQVGWKIVKYAAGNTLTLNCGGSDAFEIAGGAATSTPGAVLSSAKTYQYQHSAALWIAIGGDQSLTQLDARYIVPGASTRLVYAAGAYPARPSGVAAGLATYIGPVQPTSWLSGDDWINNS
jgi:hypothetical protein